jgi:hypothetical protein
MQDKKTKNTSASPDGWQDGNNITKMNFNLKTPTLFSDFASTSFFLSIF